MARGKPLYLNEERYAALTYMVYKCSASTSTESFKIVWTSFGFVC